MERKESRTGSGIGWAHRETDDVFDALADASRRQILLELLEDEPHVVSTLSDADEQLVDADQGLLEQYLDGASDSPDVDKELLRERSVHLPKLSEYGFADWNREADVVRRGPQFHLLRPFLELLEPGEVDVGPVALDARRPGLPKPGR